MRYHVINIAVLQCSDCSHDVYMLLRRLIYVLQ